jgi:hypothetical protein
MTFSLGAVRQACDENGGLQAAPIAALLMDARDGAK